MSAIFSIILIGLLLFFAVWYLWLVAVTMRTLFLWAHRGYKFKSAFAKAKQELS